MTSILPFGSQGKLLQLLQQGEYRRVGSSRLEHSDIWIISATNVDLKEKLKRGEFRADLYYRLAGMTIRIPALRERREDIPLLVEHFLQQESEASGAAKKRISCGLLARVIAHDWPGNIRELKSCIESSAALCRGEVITEWMGESPNLASEGKQERMLSQIGSTLSGSLNGDDVRRALDEAQGNVRAASRILRVHRSTLYRFCEKFGIPY